MVYYLMTGVISYLGFGEFQNCFRCLIVPLERAFYTDSFCDYLSDSDSCSSSRSETDFTKASNPTSTEVYDSGIKIEIHNGRISVISSLIQDKQEPGVDINGEKIVVNGQSLFN